MKSILIIFNLLLLALVTECSSVHESKTLAINDSPVTLNKKIDSLFVKKN